ncbi:MAG: EI24 domain-containing protein [Rhodospirillaceae bacterium]
MMSGVMRALLLAATDAARPRMLALMLVPACIALVVWSLAAWWYWGTWTQWFADAMAGSAVVRWSASWSSWLVSSASALLVIILLVPAVILTALLINELAVMPLLLRYVRERHYPGLRRNGFGTVLGSVVNVVLSGLLFIAVWLATLPLWFTGIGAVLAPLLNSAYLNMRVFRYDALAEHASFEEYAEIRRRTGGRLYALGLLLGALYYVPLVNLVAPVLCALAYTHFCLDELRRLRNPPAQRT